MRSRRRARSRLWVAIRAARPVWRTRSRRVVEDAVAGRVVEVAGRLVAEQDPGSLASARAIATRCCSPPESRAGPVPDARRETDPLEQPRRLFPRLPARRRGDHLRQHDVFERRKLRQQMMELVDKADLRAPQHGAPFVVEAAAILAADHHRTAVGTLQEAGDVQHRRLAGARGPDQCHDLAGPQDQVDPVQHDELDSGLLEDAPDRRAARAPVPRASASSFVAQRLDRIEPCRTPGRVECGEERQGQRHDDDGRDLARFRAVPGCG